LLRLVDRNSDAAEQARSIMERQMSHMTRLIDDLMEISRISSGKIELRREDVELADVVRSAVETSRPLIEAAGHRLALELPDEPLQLHADPLRLAQVVANLLNNAAKYTEEGDYIRLGARREGDQAVLSVRDSGLGIPPELLPRVFDMFAQIDRSLSRAQGGLGIGLALARSLVEMHDGTIEAHSEGPGRGSEFLVRLPLHEAAAPAEAAGTTAAHGAGRTDAAAEPRRILIVDDNRDAAESLAMVLKQLGHEVRTVHDSRRALATARLHRPELVLLDLSMPGLDGYAVARLLREDPALRIRAIAAITGLGQPEDRRRSREACIDEHLVKPISPETLRALLTRLS
jgi:CheY-like chemotaxis protein/two-component sensor histidine kinase